MTLRAARQAQVSSSRRDFLAKRTVKELVLLMQEKEPSDYEKKGRMSGALEWREDRGEVSSHSHTFHFVKPGAYNIHEKAHGLSEREEKGQISWKLEVEYDDLVLKDLVLVVCATTFEDGCVRCSVQFDSEPAQDIKLGQYTQTI
ncbi:Peptide-N(4)-(N-acetyl-beta-glucosaminyl)asparagine amidase [Papilio xuthus]|uniref:Peptide-N(4)-(N-acetyl-beta-glucosaminyl)asparagine amidase n=1 Tax=Papilio xuthus TaxID=66420 RepID=A0A0N1PFB8_PAPXU|nr:Peptide-N(4)-(N-acetyl-beta-glucosaminyl)asparagine amidase [Papilio xuthus]